MSDRKDYHQEPKFTMHTTYRCMSESCYPMNYSDYSGNKRNKRNKCHQPQDACYLALLFSEFREPVAIAKMQINMICSHSHKQHTYKNVNPYRC